MLLAITTELEIFSAGDWEELEKHQPRDVPTDAKILLVVNRINIVLHPMMRIAPFMLGENPKLLEKLLETCTCVLNQVFRLLMIINNLEDSINVTN